MKGGCESVGIVDPVHDVEIAVLVETARFNKAKFPLALAFGTTIKLPEPFLYGFVVTELITLSLWVLGVEAKSVTFLLVPLLVFPVIGHGLRTEVIGLWNFLLQHVLQAQIQWSRIGEYELAHTERRDHEEPLSVLRYPVVLGVDDAP